MKKILMLLVLAFLFSCKNKAPQPEKPVAKETVKEPELTLTTFPLSEVPDDMSGCGTGLYLTKADKEKERYIYIDNHATALVYINGKPVTFELSKEKGNSFYYTSGTYRLTITITKEVRSGYELLDVEAELVLQNGNYEVRKQVLGWTGC